MGSLGLLILLGGLYFLLPTVAEAKITLYSDRSGKVHITNQETTAPQADRTEESPEESNSLPNLRQSPPAPGPRIPVKNHLPEVPESISPETPQRVVRQSCSKEDTINSLNTIAEQYEPSTPSAKAVLKPVSRPLVHGARGRRREAEPLEGAIRISQNVQGVLVITNLAETDSSAPLMAGFGKTKPIVPPPPDSPVSYEDLPLYGQIIPAAHNTNPEISFSTATEVGPLRRNRDKKGVLRISNVVPAMRSNLPAVAAVGPGIRAEVDLPLTMGRSTPPAMGRTPADKPKAEVVLERDKGGRVRIFTKEPVRQVLAQGPCAPTLERINPALAPIVTEAATIYQLPASLILSVIRSESNFAPGAVSPKGAMGLMQLMPGTAADLGVQDPFCPRQNIMGGSRYLRQLLNSFNGSLPLAVAAYNAGQNRVVEAGYQIPEIKETKQFVTQVLGMYSLLEKMSLVRRLP